MPKVSVILPAYNGEKFIKKAVDSVLGQTYRDFELIVIDDGSKDSTPALLSDFGAKIKVISQANGGIAKARNAGIAAAKGEYIAFLDQDDFWLPEKLARQVELHDSDNNIGMTYTDTFIINDNGTEIRSFEIRKPRRGMIIEELFMNNFISTSAVMVRKECFDRVGLFDGFLSPVLDYDRWLNIAALYKVDYVDIPLVKFRDHVSTLRKNELFTIEKMIATLDRFINSNPACRKAMGKKADKKIASYYVLWGRRLVSRGDVKGAVKNFRKAADITKSAGTFIYAVNSVMFDLAKDAVKRCIRK